MTAESQMRFRDELCGSIRNYSELFYQFSECNALLPNLHWTTCHSTAAQTGNFFQRVSRLAEPGAWYQYYHIELSSHSRNILRQYSISSLLLLQFFANLQQWRLMVKEKISQRNELYTFLNYQLLYTENKPLLQATYYTY